MKRFAPSLRRMAAVALTAGLPMAVAVLAGNPAMAAGKPHPTYPERQEVPADATEREAKCVELRERTQKLGDSMGAHSLLGRLDFVRVYHRSAERYLEEQCGDVDANGFALSHRTERSGIIKGSPAPDAHGGGHGDAGHGEGAHEAEGGEHSEG